VKKKHCFIFEVSLNLVADFKNHFPSQILSKHNDEDPVEKNRQKFQLEAIKQLEKKQLEEKEKEKEEKKERAKQIEEQSKKKVDQLLQASKHFFEETTKDPSNKAPSLQEQPKLKTAENLEKDTPQGGDQREEKLSLQEQPKLEAAENLEKDTPQSEHKKAHYPQAPSYDTWPLAKQINYIQIIDNVDHHTHLLKEIKILDKTTLKTQFAQKAYSLKLKSCFHDAQANDIQPYFLLLSQARCTNQAAYIRGATQPLFDLLKYLQEQGVGKFVFN